MSRTALVPRSLRGVRTKYCVGLAVGIALSSVAGSVGTAAGASPRHKAQFAQTPTAHGVSAEPKWGELGLSGLDGAFPENAVLGPPSCGSAGNCSAGGNFQVNQDTNVAFVVDEVNGAWGHAQLLPGMDSLAPPGSWSTVLALSCGAPGYCTAAGAVSSIYSADGTETPFVVNEINGKWGNVEAMPGLGALNGTPPLVDSISCRSAGNCSAGGSYGPIGMESAPWVDDEVNGVWGKAQQVPGILTLVDGLYNADLGAVSCGSPGNCVASGSYDELSGTAQAWLAEEVGGVWGDATHVTAPASPDSGTSIDLVSCGSAGNCSVGGLNLGGPFVVDEVDGVWSTPHGIPGIAALTGGSATAASLQSLSCTSSGACSAGGDYVDVSGHVQAFVDVEVGGQWSDAEEVPGTSALEQGGSASLDAVSCSSPGNCGATGLYSTTQPSVFEEDAPAEFYVVHEANGVWGDAAQAVDGLFTVSQGVWSGGIDCPTDGSCSDVVINTGYCSIPVICATPFVLNETAGSWTRATTVAGLVPPAGPTIRAVVSGRGSFTAFWSQPDGYGAPIASYTLKVSPGGKSCTTSATHCTIRSLLPSQQYSMTVTATNPIQMSGLPSAAVWAYPVATQTLKIWPSPLVSSPLTQFPVGAIGGRPGGSVTISVPHEWTRRCRFNVAGQCSLVAFDNHVGAETVTATVGSSQASSTLYGVLISTPSEVKHGERTYLSLTSCPPMAVVHIATSDHRYFATQASATGAALLRFQTFRKGRLILTVQVAGEFVGKYAVTVD